MHQYKCQDNRRLAQMQIHVHDVKSNGMVIVRSFGFQFLTTRHLSSLPLEGTDISSLHTDTSQLFRSPVCMATKLKSNLYGHIVRSQDTLAVS